MTRKKVLTILLVAVLMVVPLQVGAAKSFADVPREEWYASNVYGALDKGIVNG